MKAIKFSVAAAAALAVSAFAADGDVLKPYGAVSGEVGLYQIKGADGQGIDVRSYANRFGLKGAHALDGGLTAVYQVEVGFNTVTGDIALDSRTGQDHILGSSTSKNDGSISSRNSFVGVAGGFGTFLIGNHDTPYKLAARGSGAVSNADTVADLHLQTDRRLKGAVAYVAPADAVGGATIAAAIVPAHTTDDKGEPQNNFSYSLGAVVPVDIVTIGAGVEIANVSNDNDKDEVTETSFFAGVNAKLGDQFTVGLAYENVSDSGKLAKGAVKPKGKFSTILVPFTANLGDGLYANAGVRYTIVDKKGAPAAAGYAVLAGGNAAKPKEENQLDVGFTVGKKWGKDLDLYAGLKFTKTSEKTKSFATDDKGKPSEDTGFDFGIGLKVAFN
jgi:predicted porin